MNFALDNFPDVNLLFNELRVAIVKFIDNFLHFMFEI
jgi:hypothetical protein